jgi:serine/threonine-protein kinase HipA
VKNIAFLMNRKGEWRLSPAFDVSYAYNSSGAWTSQHQLSLNGKRDHFQLADLVEFGRFCDLKSSAASKIIDEIKGLVLAWSTYADRAGVAKLMADSISRTMRTELPA